MTAGHSETSRQRDTNDDPHVPEHSQTLPMITEEVAVAPAKTAETPTQHVSTQVIPPNPVRRETPAAPNTAAPNDVTAPAIVAAPAGESAGEAGERGEEVRRPDSATQLIAGAGAAATSSVIGGQLGVAGTVVGAGVASIITALAVTLYGRSLDKGKEKIQEISSKLAPAVKAKIAKNRSRTRTAPSILLSPRIRPSPHRNLPVSTRTRQPPRRRKRNRSDMRRTPEPTRSRAAGGSSCAASGPLPADHRRRCLRHRTRRRRHGRILHRRRHLSGHLADLTIGLGTVIDGRRPGHRNLRFGNLR